MGRRPKRGRAKQRRIDPEGDLRARSAAMFEVASQVADDARSMPDEKRRICAIVVFEQDDRLARAIAEAVAREWGKPLTLPPPGAGTYAMLCPHHILVDVMRRAGWAVPDATDPGVGLMQTVFLHAGRCECAMVIVDREAHERQRALLDELDALPPEVLTGIAAMVREALGRPEEHRRRHEAIVVCECNDARACRVVEALARERQKDIRPAPDGAASLIHPHADVARIARELGYAFDDPPEPRIGRMRAFVFARGRIIASDMEIESEAEVARRAEEAYAAVRPFSRRILEEKEHVLRRAAATLLADPHRRLTQIVVVFGSSSTFARRVYRELAALPGQRGFPPELPAGVPAVAVSYDSFMDSARGAGVHLGGIAASELGPNEVRLAIITPEGVDLRRLQSTPLARGGAA